ncbi:MAG TPA: hypothetical protein VK181_20505 [Rhizobium sp.]|nr:hypothetical protein [Rhizobium sp.]
MATVKLDISDLPAAILADVDRLRDGVIGAVRQAAKRAHAHLVTESHEQIEDTTGDFANSWQVEETPTGAIVYNSAPHALIVEEGSRPHHPRVEPILRWLARKGAKSVSVPGTLTSPTSTVKSGPWQAGPLRRRLSWSGRWDLSDQGVFQGQSAHAQLLEALRQHAVAIARKIGRNGTKPKRILFMSLPRFRQMLEEEVKAVAI